MRLLPTVAPAILVLSSAACEGLIVGPAVPDDDGTEVDSAPEEAADAAPTAPDSGASMADSAPVTIDAASPPDTLALSGDFCEEGEVVVMEAESYSAQEGYAAVARTDASGGTAMQVGDSGSLDFEVFLTTPGVYFFWIRTLASDAESNGIYVALDGELIEAPPENPYAGVTDIYLKKSATQWFWDPAWQGAGSGAVQGPVTFVASAGQHTLSIRKRKMERPLIDKIVLTVADEIPTSLGPAETPCP